MAVIIWLVLVALIVSGYVSGSFPWWVPLIIYLVSIAARGWQKITDQRDWMRMNKRDEVLRMEEIANEMTERGLTFSGIREKEERKAHEDFVYERKKRARKLWIDLLDSVFLK